MQTFLPYPSYEKTAKCLDYKRLGKQRIEALQILDTLKGNSKGWSNHPAVHMWKGCEGQLALYGKTMCLEWIAKGYKDTRLPIFDSWLTKLDTQKVPTWLGNEDFHLSHKSNLLRKNFEHYKNYFSGVSPNLPYIWP